MNKETRKLLTAQGETQLADSILAFWFDEIDRAYWFRKDTDFDQLVKDRFGNHVERALRGDYDSWDDSASLRLSLIILLDQMTRNIFRGDAKAFSGDARALSLTLKAVAEGQLDAEATIEKRQFLLMPLMHSEDIEVQDRSISIYERYADRDTLEYAKQHRDVIARFGRFPHRNAVLGRESTPEEIEFIQTPGSAF